MLDQLKAITLSEYFLFNQPDGLIIASTIGKIELNHKLQFMKLEIGTLESNIYQIFTTIMNLSDSPLSPLELSTVIYESDNNYIIVKEVSNGSVLMIVTKNKTSETFKMVIDSLNGDKYRQLSEFLNKNEF